MSGRHGDPIASVPAVNALGRAAARGVRLRVAVLVVACAVLAAHLAVSLARGQSLDVVVAAVDGALALALVVAAYVHIRELVRERQRLALAEVLLELGGEPQRIRATADAALSALLRNGLADAGVVAVVGDGAPEARPLVAAGYPPGWVDAARPLPLEDPPPAAVARRAAAPPPWGSALRPALGSRPWCATVTLLAGGAPIGVLFLAARRRGPMRDAATLEMTGRLVAALLHQAELYEAAYERERELEGQASRHREFLAAIAHEVRTPLTSIHAFADLLADAAATANGNGSGATGDAALAGANRDRLVGSLTRGVERLTSLINDLLELGESDADVLRFEAMPVDVGDVVRLATSMLDAAFTRRDQTLRLELPERPVYAIGDRRHLEQVVLNLLSNAHRHTPAGGAIAIRVSAGGGTVRLEVEDTGPGVDPADRKRIFEAYYRVHRPGAAPVPGSGLGLAVARRLVRLQGGRIWVDDAPGGGARFCVELRAAGGVAFAAHEQAMGTEEPARRAANPTGEHA